MILSKNQMFSDGQNLTATGVSTNVIDLGAPGTVKGAPAAIKRDIGKGRPVKITIRLDADAGGASPTLDVVVQKDTVENFASAEVVATGTQIAGGSQGDEVDIYLLPEQCDQRYLRLSYTLGGTSPDYTITAGIVLARKQHL